ncbi:glutathione S-transferase omega-1 [Apiospora aurea]|uniref:Glutathione S-transferase omega-1 n=1 Tax=Apiospora aurea TaxID=335848 RepID=A0ABR1PUW0_9PEZI
MQHQPAHIAHHHHHHHHHHHASSPPPQPPNDPPPPHFPLSTLSSNNDIGLVLDGPDPSFYLDHTHPPCASPAPTDSYYRAHPPTWASAAATPAASCAAPSPATPPCVECLSRTRYGWCTSSASTAAANAALKSPPPANHGVHVSQGPFNLLTPGLIAQLPQEEDYMGPGMGASSSQTPESLENRPHGQLVNRIVTNPPDLEGWRQKLFHVDDMIILTNDDFETYFPHIDNVYSHRSTQKYKRKPFISHYWDCRMKGRPPGTPKSDDPSKKKRKRNARERDLCDVKIKITEYFAGATIQLDDGMTIDGTQAPLVGDKFWTIQRVNGNGGNGKQDGVAGPHKHSLAKSDEIKKSTVQRFIQAQEKEAKKIQKPAQRKATGAAQLTVKSIQQTTS